MVSNARIAAMLACFTAMLAMQRFAWRRVECMVIVQGVVGTASLHAGASTFANRLVDGFHSEELGCGRQVDIPKIK